MTPVWILLPVFGITCGWALLRPRSFARALADTWDWIKATLTGRRQPALTIAASSVARQKWLEHHLLDTPVEEWDTPVPPMPGSLQYVNRELARVNYRLNELAAGTQFIPPNYASPVRETSQ